MSRESLLVGGGGGTRELLGWGVRRRELAIRGTAGAGLVGGRRRG